jgi:hypothetical protein
MVGPLISSYMGWQVSRSAARAQVRENVTDQLAMICAARAKAEVAGAGALDWTARSELAKKWAVEAVAPLTDLDITGACTRRIAA